MKIVGSIFVFLLCSLSVLGQKNISLLGTVLDKEGEQTIIGSNVELLNPKDSTIVTGAISDVNGIFSFKSLASGNYILKITYIGYKPIIQNLKLTKEKTNVNLGKLYMEVDAILLAETVVKGKRPDIIVKNDTIEYDAASYKVTENAVIEDLLKRLPGVEIDKDGKITVNGKEVKKFLIEDKEFFSDDPQIASKNLPADMVEKLQVVDRKSEMAQMTGFDDGEEETIINFTIKPGMKKGTMGNAFVGAGADMIDGNDLRYRAAGFLNRMQENDRYTFIAGTNNNNNMGAGDLGAQQFGGMRTRRGSGGITKTTNFMASIEKELSPFTSLNGDIRYTGMDRLSTNKVTETTVSERLSQIDRSSQLNQYLSNAVSANFRFEWEPDTMNTLIFRPNFVFNNSKSYEESALDRRNKETEAIILTEVEDAQAQGRGFGFGGNLEYSHKFHKPGRVLSFNIRGNYNDSYSHENNHNNTIRSVEEEFISILQNRRDENDNGRKTFQGSASWVEPLGRNNFLQLLYRFNYSNTKDVNSTYDLWKDLADYDPLLVMSMLDNDSIASLVLDQSRSTLRNSSEHRITLSFKSVREKYNYTIGLNVDPSYSLNETYQPSYNTVRPIAYSYDERLPNVQGDSLFSSIEQNVMNFSPVINFNYLFGQRSNLRIDYSGETNQPSANQLRDYIDMTRPNNWVEGNSDLKPGYSNSLRMRFQKYVAETQLNYNLMLNGGFSVNDIISTMEMMDNGIRMTSYRNVNGNWNTSFRGGFNTPLRNKKFTVGSNLSVNYRNQKSFVNALENTLKNFQVRIGTNSSYRSDLFDLGINANFSFNDIVYTVRPEDNQKTYNYGISGFTTWYLPYDLVIESDVNWTARSGYASGYNIPEVIWNASMTKQLFSKSYGTGSLKLEIYDILKNQSNVSSYETTNGFRTSEVNSLPSYFMCSFIYKFTSFPKASRSGDNEPPMDRGFRREGGQGRMF